MEGRKGKDGKEEWDGGRDKNGGEGKRWEERMGKGGNN